MIKPYKFKPIEGQSYWYVDVDGKPNQTLWYDQLTDYLNFEIGNTYRYKSDIGTEEMIYMQQRIKQDYRNYKEEE